MKLAPMTHITPVPTGHYWVRLFEADEDWQPAYIDAGEVFIIGAAESFRQIAEVGPEILAPE